MPRQETFLGLRKAFLKGEQARYKEALSNGTKDDFLMDVLRRFLKRFPIDLPDSQEPSAEHLAAVDDALPDPERVAPHPEDHPQDQEGYNSRKEAFDETTRRIEFRSEQIARWFNYRLDKSESREETKPDSKPVLKLNKNIDLHDPMTILTLRLLGKPVARPRKSTDVNCWAKVAANRAAIDRAYMAAAPGKSMMNLKLRGRIAQHLFDRESEEVQKAYSERAEAEHQATMKAWEDLFTRPASPSLESRQACIDGIASFMQPILDLVVEFTGMRVSFLMGGPEPAAGGRLNIIGLHSGGTKGSVKAVFPQAEPEKYHKQVIPAFSDFLRKCYSREDCQASTLLSHLPSDVNCAAGDQLMYTEASGESHGPSDQPSGAPSPTLVISTTQSKAPHHAAEQGTKGTDDTIMGLEGNQRPDVQSQPQQADAQAPHGSRFSPADSLYASSIPSSYSVTRLSSLQDDSNVLVKSQASRDPFPASFPKVSVLEDFSSPASITSPEGASSTLLGQFPSSPSPVSPIIPGKKRSRLTADGGCRRKGSSTRPLKMDVVRLPSLFASPLSKASRAANVRKSSRQGGRQRRQKKAEGENIVEQSDKENRATGSKRKAAPTLEESGSKRRKTVQQHAATSGPAEQSLSSAGLVTASTVNVHLQSGRASAAGPGSSRLLWVADLAVQLPLPVDCDPGVRNTLSMLTSVSWGSKWELLTAEWICFEKIHDFKGSAKFKPTCRPVAIADWIKRARAPSFKPQVDILIFQADFWRWWAALQPKWRKIAAGNTSRHIGGKWDEVDVPGVNGWPSVLVALLFWGLGLGEERYNSSSWMDAVDDVYWVLTQLCRQLSP